MKERIAVNSEIHFGKPCITGTRIPVQSVLELVREGLGFDAIIPVISTLTFSQRTFAPAFSTP